MKSNQNFLIIIAVQCLLLSSSMYGEDSTGKEGEVKKIIEFLPEETKNWAPVNDTVMGGVSRSTIEQATESSARFKGVLSLENNGGFASVRSRPKPFDLSENHGLAIRVRGDGKKYQIRVRTDDRFDGPTYRCSFETTRESWTVHEFPFSDFAATYRGRILRDHRPLDPAKIQSFGFLISDKQEGAFSLEIDWIGVY